jgi:hypothetical protein
MLNSDETVPLRVLRHVGAGAHDDARHVGIAGDGLNQRPLFRRVVENRAGAAEDVAEHPHADGRVALGARHEDRARRDGMRAVERVAIPVVEEQAEIVRLAVLSQIPHQRPAHRPFGLNPLELVAKRVRFVEDPFGQPSRRRLAA